MRALLIALALAALPLPALALEARASGNTTVRDGPGDRYERLGRLVDGKYYEVEECTREARWCLVSYDGDVLGWVRGSYLVGSPAKVEATPPDFDFLDPPGTHRFFFD